MSTPQTITQTQIGAYQELVNQQGIDAVAAIYQALADKGYGYAGWAYGIGNQNIWSVSIDKANGWILVELPKHPQQYMYGDYAVHFIMYYMGEVRIKFSLEREKISTNDGMIYKWSNLHAFSGWEFIGKTTVIGVIKDALTAYGAGSSIGNKNRNIVQCNFA